MFTPTEDNIFMCTIGNLVNFFGSLHIKVLSERSKSSALLKKLKQFQELSIAEKS